MAKVVPIPNAAIIEAPVYQELEDIAPNNAPTVKPHGKKPNITPYINGFFGVYFFRVLTTGSFVRKLKNALFLVPLCRFNKKFIK